MYDPSGYVPSSHRASSSRTYIMNVLGAPKSGFWADMPNRFRPRSAPATSPMMEGGGLVKYGPKALKYISQNIQANPSKYNPNKDVKPTPLYNPPPAAPPKPAGINYQQVWSQFDKITNKPLDNTFSKKGLGLGDVTLEHSISDKNLSKDFIPAETRAELAVLKGKPMPKKQKVSQGSSVKVVAKAVTNQNYYKPAPYVSMVKPMSSGIMYR